MLIPVVVIAIALPSADAPIAPIAPIEVVTPQTERFTFVYDGVVGVVTRGARRGTDADRVAGTFVDERTGRTAPVLVGASVLVRGAIDDTIASSIVVVHDSMPS